MHVTVLVGPAGSGKSLYAEQLQNRGALVINVPSYLVNRGVWAFDPEKVLTHYRPDSWLVFDGDILTRAQRKEFSDMEGQGVFVEFIEFGHGEKSESFLANLVELGHKPEDEATQRVFHTTGHYEPIDWKREDVAGFRFNPRQLTFVAFDFDGTLCEAAFPQIGIPNTALISAIHTRFMMDKNFRPIIFTCRSGKYEDLMRAWLKEQDCPVDWVNVNPYQKTWSKSPKAFAHIYVDDMAWGCNPWSPYLPELVTCLDWPTKFLLKSDPGRA